MQPRRLLQQVEPVCLWCEETFTLGNLDVHHLVPRAIDGPDKPFNLAPVCRNHHLRLTVAFRHWHFPQWWDAGEPWCELGKCFAWGLRGTDTPLPAHVESAITLAWYLKGGEYSAEWPPIAQALTHESRSWMIESLHDGWMQVEAERLLPVAA